MWDILWFMFCRDFIWVKINKFYLKKCPLVLKIMQWCEIDKLMIQNVLVVVLMIMLTISNLQGHLCGSLQATDSDVFKFVSHHQFLYGNISFSSQRLNATNLDIRHSFRFIDGSLSTRNQAAYWVQDWPPRLISYRNTDKNVLTKMWTLAVSVASIFPLKSSLTKPCIVLFEIRRFVVKWAGYFNLWRWTFFIVFPREFSFVGFESY